MLFEIQDVIPVEKERKKKHMPELFHWKPEQKLT